MSGSSTLPTTNWPLRIVATVAVVAMLPVAKQFLLPVTLAILLALVLARPVATLHRRGLPEPVGAALVVSALLVALATILIALAEPAGIWLERAPASSAELGRLLDRLRESLPLLHAAAVGSASASGAEAINETLASERVTLTRIVLGQATGFALGAAATLILLYFLLAFENWLLVHMIRHARSGRARVRALALARGVQRDVAQFLITMSLLNVVLGVATALTLWMLGLPNPTLWGALAALLNFVPYLGPLGLMVLLLMAGVATFDSFGLMVAPALLSLLINAVVTYLVHPLVLGRRLDLNPIGILLSVMFWGWAWGVAGTLVAVPILLAARQVCRSSRNLRPLTTWLDRPAHQGRTIQAVLRAQMRSPWWRMRREPVAAHAARTDLRRAAPLQTDIGAAHARQRSPNPDDATRPLR